MERYKEAYIASKSASVLLKLIINGNEQFHAIDAS